jgi:hypothetical protein
MPGKRFSSNVHDVVLQARAIPWRIAYLFRLSESGVRIWGLMYLPPLILRKS